MSKIYDFPISYSLLKKYVVFTFKRYYSEYIVVGRENIPTDCPLIFAPNHTNALMDALAIASVSPQNKPIIFLARADIFKKKTAAKVLNFVKIMPAFRMRDGVENLGKNSEIFDSCKDVLDHNIALGIMPEGNQEIERKLRPLVKGIFRIAFSAQQKYGTQPGVKIVPIGIDFGDLEKFGKHIIISIGKPIEVSDYMADYETNSVTATNEIREKLRYDLSNLSLDLATDKYYQCFETATEIANTAYINKLQLPDRTVYRFVARQKIAKKLVSIEKTEPEKIIKIDSLCAEHRKILKETNLRNWVLEQAPHGNFPIILDGLFLLWTLPLFICGLALNFLPFFTPVYLRKKVFKAEFPGFFSSLQYALGIITIPLFYLLQTVFFYSLVTFPWWIYPIFFIAQYPLGKWALKWYRLAKKLNAKIRFNSLTHEKSSKVEHLQHLRNEIIELID